MKFSKIFALPLIAAALFVLGYQWASAVPPTNDPKKDERQPSLDARYAGAQVALAEANLKRLTEMNQKVANLVSADTLNSFQQDLKVAQAELAAATSRDAAHQFEVWLRRAESAVSYADLQWRSAVAANQRSAGVFSPIDVERRRLRLEVSRLELERGQALTHAAPDQQLVWEISLMNNELQRLKEEVLQPVTATPAYPTWWRD
jgi:hypothetical protein